MLAADDQNLDASTDTPNRGPGRPKGFGKVPGSGRKAGTPNKLTLDVRTYIMEKGKPLELLFKISCGQKVKVGDVDGNSKLIYPSLTDRASAARALLSKVLPDIKATEITGADGGPIETKSVAGGLNQMAELARRLSFVMASGDAAARVTVETQPIASLQPEQVVQPVVEVEADSLDLPQNQRDDNRAISANSDRSQVVTRRV
jgi:hypothetical protein